MSGPSTTSSAQTQGILVEVQSQYLEEQSHPPSRRFVFAYTITVTNHGKEVVQLRSRHWIITNALGESEEVRGAGVVGEQRFDRMLLQRRQCPQEGEVYRRTSLAFIGDLKLGAVLLEHRLCLEQAPSGEGDVRAQILAARDPLGTRAVESRMLCFS